METEIKWNAKTLIYLQKYQNGDKKVLFSQNIYLPMSRNIFIEKLNSNGGNSRVTTLLWRSYK